MTQRLKAGIILIGVMVILSIIMMAFINAQVAAPFLSSNIISDYPPIYPQIYVNGEHWSYAKIKEAGNKILIPAGEVQIEFRLSGNAPEGYTFLWGIASLPGVKIEQPSRNRYRLATPTDTPSGTWAFTLMYWVPDSDPHKISVFTR